jgi:hypothetical protein
VKLLLAETLQHEVSIVRAMLHVFQFTSVRTNFLADIDVDRLFRLTSDVVKGSVRVAVV